MDLASPTSSDELRVALAQFVGLGGEGRSIQTQHWVKRTSPAHTTIIPTPRVLRQEDGLATMWNVHLLFIGIPLWIETLLRVRHVPCPLVLLSAQVLLNEDRSGKEAGDPGAPTIPLPRGSQLLKACYTGEETELREL